MLKASSTDIQLGIRLIIIRFKKERLATPPIAHWLLDILQMCVLHCTQEFLVAINDMEVLETFREVLTNRYDDVVCLKLSTLLKSWHEQFNFAYPDSDFKRTCEVESTRGKPTNLHWFPNRNIAKEEDPEKQANMTLQLVEADLRFWEDIVQHTGLSQESLQGLRKVQFDVHQTIRNLERKPGTVSSRTGDHGSALRSDAFQFEGGNRGPDRQSAQLAA
ncbi:unnamed protein product [Dibothriocephalus latus]|uniref:VHS domain-containing protein n=1 Tax=Dibothriocephalus latus TaxID=60516 RepID=A0A3P6V6G4_DIBLA|nr:unnamed protein product [Dibothriocephalus latus]